MKEGVRLSSFEQDGWQLGSGEIRHREFPESFWIPDRYLRETRKVGDLVKLIFEYEADLGAERMWVSITDRRDGFYIGSLDNVPHLAKPRHRLNLGTKIVFLPEHIIDIDDGDE